MMTLIEWRKRLYILLSLLSIAVGVLAFSTLLKSPYLGIGFESRDGKWFVSSVSPDNQQYTRLKELVGKEVTAIGGFRLRTYDLAGAYGYIPDKDSFEHFWEAQRWLDEHVKAGIPITITFTDLISGQAGQVNSTVQIVPSKFPLYQAVSWASAQVISAVAALLIGLIVALKRPGDKKAALFFLVSFFGSLVLFTYGIPLLRESAYNIHVFQFTGLINFFAYMIGSVVFLHFCLVFPVEKGRISRNVPAALYVFSVLIFLLYLSGRNFYSWKIAVIFSILCITGGMASMVHSYITMKSPEKKVRIKWLLYGIGLFMGLYLMFVYRSIYYGPDTFIEFFIGIAVLIIPLSMAFAILKYRLVDIDTLVDNTLIYSITLGGLAIIDMGVTSFLVNLRLYILSEFFVSVMSVWVIIFAYIPLRNCVKGIIKRLLKREVYDPNLIALELSKGLISASDIRAALEKTISAITKTLHPKGVDVFLYDEKNHPHLNPLPEGEEISLPFNARLGMGLFSGNIPSYLQDALMQKVKEIKAPLHLFSIIPSKGLPQGYSGGAVVPVIGSTGTLGWLLLKDKHSTRLYDREDMKLLSIIANQTAMSIEAIRHKEATGRRDREAREEKERITRDIHDGISSEFSGIMGYVERVRAYLDAGDLGHGQEILENIGASSQRGVRELRNIISAIDMKDETLEFVIGYIKRYSCDLLNTRGITLSVPHAVVTPNVTLPASRFINLIRITQEACHNIIKHSGASEARIDFLKNGEWLILIIEDNGKGFDPSAAANNGGHGLRNMGKRMKELGGDITFISSPGKGTLIEARIPVS